MELFMLSLVLITNVSLVWAALLEEEYQIINVDEAAWEQISVEEGPELLCPLFACNNSLPSWRHDSETNKCILGRIKEPQTLMWHPNGFGLNIYAAKDHVKQMKRTDPHLLIVGGTSSTNLEFNLATLAIHGSRPAYRQSTWSSVHKPVLGMTQTGFMACSGRTTGTDTSCQVLAFGNTKWETSSITMNEGRYLAAFSIVRGAIYVTGGERSEVPITAAEMFNGRSWVVKPDLPTPRSGHCQLTLEDKRVIVIGGKKDPLNYSPFTHVYDFVKDAWQQLADFPRSRRDMACMILKNSDDQEIVVAAGGYDRGTFVSMVDIYNVNTNTWSTDDPLPAGMDCFGFRQEDGKKGLIFSSFQSLWYEYDPEGTPRWTPKSAFNQGRFETAIRYVNGI